MENITQDYTIGNTYGGGEDHPFYCHVYFKEKIHSTAIGRTKEIVLANAQLIADSGNTFNKHGLTPSELLEQNKIMKDALESSLQMLEQTSQHRKSTNQTAGNTFLESTISEVREALNKTQPTNT